MEQVKLLPLLLLAGCFSNPSTPCADIPVYTKPVIEMPIRPVMRSTGEKQDPETVRDLHKDVLELKDYSIQLENILLKLK